ncbi:MAG: pseudouridine synthase [Candidatus Pacebacteria bacterium]|nr:pseudouridine synthase [Candidatus Paceibacterota bacterium]
MEYPIRINKYLAEKGICSRREADKLIEEGKVQINGTQVKLGEMVSEDDKVNVADNLKELFYIAYNKPAGIVTNCPQKGEKEIKDILKLDFGYFPVGRLDKHSRGLLLLSNDGRITDKLLNPHNYHEKEYEVEVNREMQDNDLRQLRQGITLDGGFMTKPCEIKMINDRVFSIILTEGKNRQIRRMCLALGYDVIDLNRIRIMNIRLNDMPEGHYKKLSGEVLEELLGELGLDDRERTENAL